MDYTVDFQEVMLKQNLKVGIELKKELLSAIRQSNNQAILEDFLASHNLEDQLLRDQEMLEIYAESDPELIELIGQDMDILAAIRNEAEQKLEQVPEKDNENKEEKAEENKFQEGAKEEVEPAELEEDIVDDTPDGAATEQGDTEGLIPMGDQTQDVEKNFEGLSLANYNALSPEQQTEHNAKNIKAEQHMMANTLKSLKEFLAENPNSIMVQSLANMRQFFQGCHQLSEFTQSQPWADEELKMLCSDSMNAITELEQEIDGQLYELLEQQQKDDLVLAEEEPILEDLDQEIDMEAKLEAEAEMEKEPEAELVEKDETEKETVTKEYKETDFLVGTTSENGMGDETLEKEDKQEIETPKKSWELSKDQQAQIDPDAAVRCTEEQSAAGRESPAAEQDYDMAR